MNAGEACIGNVILGRGMPKICVPVMGKTVSRIAQAAQRAKDAKADIIELRMDSMCPAPDICEAIAACETVRAHAPGIALLFTLRTQRDGGAGSPQALPL